MPNENSGRFVGILYSELTVPNTLRLINRIEKSPYLAKMTILDPCNNPEIKRITDCLVIIGSRKH